MGDINAKVDATTKEWNEQQGSLREERINPNPSKSGIVLCVLSCSHKQPFPSKMQIYNEREICQTARKSQSNAKLCSFHLPNRPHTK